MKATKIYRDNFVYNINSPLCDIHAGQTSTGPYSYIETYEGNLECSQCKYERRQEAYNKNLIHWQLEVEGNIILESKDKVQFWDRVKNLCKLYGNDFKYNIKETY